MTTLGTRYPTLAFISGGVGEADDGIPPQPFETFCYDSALLQAKIENFNVIPYTSVLPKELYGNILPAGLVKLKFDVNVVPDASYTRDYEELFREFGLKNGLVQRMVDGRETDKNYYTDDEE